MKYKVSGMKTGFVKSLFFAFAIFYILYSSLYLFPKRAFAMSDTLYASGDILVNSWDQGTCATNLWDCINEGTVSYNDSDYIQTTTVVTNGEYTFTSTSSPADVAVVTAFTVKIRAMKTDTKSSATIDTYYSTDGSDPSTQVGTTANLTDALAEYTFTASSLSLSKSQIDNLRIKFVANAGSKTAAQVTASQTDITYDPVNPQSTNYGLEQYAFGAGGSGTDMSSLNFGMFGTVGEVETGRPYSTNYKAGSGLIYTLKLNVPPAPTFSNPATNYDRLKFILDEGGNASDVTYAISISTDNFASDIRYVKSDLTVGPTLATSDFKTYANWGGATGAFISSLSSGTTYYIRAKARLGDFTDTEWGPATTGVSTSYSSLTFALDSSQITFDNLNEGNSYTDSSKSTTMTTSTNAYGGYGVYAKETQSLTSLSNDSIPDYAGTNEVPTSWTGTGFGYTTDDSDLGGTGGANRFSSGTKYAGFVTSGSGDIVADNSGPVEDPIISNEQFTVSYRITGDTTTPVGIYSNVILYTIVPTF